ncbi:hypothetical protein ACLB2K_030791 [Fragaria x ananassa]
MVAVEREDQASEAVGWRGGAMRWVKLRGVDLPGSNSLIWVALVLILNRWVLPFSGGSWRMKLLGWRRDGGDAIKQQQQFGPRIDVACYLRSKGYCLGLGSLWA